MTKKQMTGRKSLFLSSVQKELQLERDYAQRLEQAKNEGRLLENSPMEQNLKLLTELVERQSLLLTKVTPGSFNQSENIAQRRFLLKSSGRFEDMVSFFAQFETSPFWADVTHVKITRSVLPGSSAAGDLELAVSFFSKADEEKGASSS